MTLRRSLIATLALLALAACTAPTAPAQRELVPGVTNDLIPSDTTATDSTARGYPLVHG